MCLPVATLAILENVPQGKKNVFKPVNQTLAIKVWFTENQKTAQPRTERFVKAHQSVCIWNTTKV